MMNPVSTPRLGRTRRNERFGTFAERFPVLFESRGRIQKAAKILAVLDRFPGVDAAQSTLLEVGASTGIMAGEFARACHRVVAFDMDHVALRAGAERAQQDIHLADRMSFLVGDGCRMPVGDEAVDIVVCNQVYEHVDDQQGLLNEIYRVLRPGGICYFGIGTRHVFIEGHYRLPFLSWLPPRLADIYIKLRGANLVYDVKLLSYRRLKKLVRRFSVFDYTVDIINRPDAYAAGDVMERLRWLSRVPFGVLKLGRPLLPVHVWVLQKPSPSDPRKTMLIRKNEETSWKRQA